MSALCRIVVAGIILLSLSMTNSGQETPPYLELNRLAKHYNISWKEEGIIQLTDKFSHTSRIFKTGTSDLILSPQIQIFDLFNEDTSIYRNRYIYHDEIPIRGLMGSYPPVCADLNNNTKLDIIGTYLPPDDRDTAMVAIVELQDDETFKLTRIYNDPPVIATIPVTHLFSDDEVEINLIAYGGVELYNFISDTPFTYPDSVNFMYVLWEQTGGPCNARITDADNDGITDLLHIGQERATPAGQKVFVSEYDSNRNNFIKRFSYLAETYDVWGLAYGDFDADGHMEFLTGSIDGDVFVYENIANDQYAPIFHDTISTPNAYLVCATNDIDHNGRTEFFVGGSSYYHEIGGTKVYWFEADGNNHYFKKYTFFLSGTDVLGYTEIFNFDVDADGVDELVFCFSFTVVILKWNQNGYFDLVYLDWVEDWRNEISGVSIYDIYGSGKPNLIVGFRNIERDIPYYSIIYDNNLISGMSLATNLISTPNEFTLCQNYPNPFNTVTNVRFKIGRAQTVSIIVYNIAGREVRRLASTKQMFSGEYEITWDGRNNNGKEVSSGIYILRFSSEHSHSSIKMILSK